MKKSLILPALAILALAACDDNKTDQSSNTTDTTTAGTPLVETSPIVDETAPAADTAMAPAADATTSGEAMAPASDAAMAPAPAEDTAGNAGPAEGTTAEGTPPAPSPEAFSEENTDTDTACGDYAAWVGQPVDEAAVKATGKVYRIIKPGDAMTMDHNPDRVNVEHDDANKVTRVWCG